MAPAKKSSSAKAPAKKPMHIKKHVVPAPPKSQYELERDERIKRNEKFMLSIGLNPYGSGGYVKQNTTKAPPKPRGPKKYVPESQRRRSARLQGGTAGPERLTYDNWSDDERPRQRSRGSGGRRTRKNRLVELSEEQRAALESFNIYDFEASASASFTKPRHRRDGVITSPYTHRFMEPDGEHPVSEQNRRSVIRQVRKLVSGEGVTYAYWPDGVVFRKGEPVTMQSDISAIIEDARDYEDQYGEDRGHGWLLNHPLRKLLFYQHYLDTKARLAPAKAEPAPTTPTKKAKKAKTSLVGKAVIKAFKGYKNARDGTPYFDGVVKSVEDGKCLITWEDGDETSMTEAAVQKILL